jgi:hypothetical protein
VGSLLTFDIPQTALFATLDTYDFIFLPITSSSHFNIFLFNGELYTVYDSWNADVADVADVAPDYRSGSVWP